MLQVIFGMTTSNCSKWLWFSKHTLILALLELKKAKIKTTHDSTMATTSRIYNLIDDVFYFPKILVDSEYATEDLPSSEICFANNARCDGQLS